MENLKVQVQLLTGDLQTAADKQADEISHLKIRDNIVEQRDRNRGIRVKNLKVPDNITSTELTNKLYNEVFQNMFVEAAKDGLLPARQTVIIDERGEAVISTSSEVELPLQIEVIEFCHVLPGGRPANMPPGAQPRRAARIPDIIVKLHSRNLKEIIYKYKKSTLGKLNRDKNLSKPNSVYIVDDLTQTNLNCLNDLKGYE